MSVPKNGAIGQSVVVKSKSSFMKVYLSIHTLHPGYNHQEVLPTPGKTWKVWPDESFPT